MSTLILTLPDSAADAAEGYDFVLAREEGLVAESGCTPLALLPPATELVALVPVHKLSWQQVRLPRGSLGRGMFRDGGPGRLRAVLDGVLEERVLDDPAELHFALAPDARDEAPVWVAVCDRVWLQTAVGALEQAGRPVRRIVPELAPELASDTATQVLHVMGEPDAARLVAVTPAGVAQWPLSGAALAQLNWPTDQPVLAEPAVAALAEQLMHRAVTLQQAPQRHLQALQGDWDLAQFELANSGSARSWRRLAEAAARLARAPRWRPLRLAVLVALLVNLIGLNAWAWKEQSALQTQRQAIRDVLTSTFVKVQVVVDAPLQMARELAALQRASGQASGRDLEAMLGAYAALAPNQAAPEAIDYSAGELRIKGIALQPDELASLSLRLKARGYVALTDATGLVIRSGSER